MLFPWAASHRQLDDGATGIHLMPPIYGFLHQSSGRQPALQIKHALSKTLSKLPLKNSEPCQANGVLEALTLTVQLMQSCILGCTAVSLYNKMLVLHQ